MKSMFPSKAMILKAPFKLKFVDPKERFRYCNCCKRTRQIRTFYKDNEICRSCSIRLMREEARR